MRQWLFAALQYLLPKHLMSRGIYALMRTSSVWVKNRTLKIFLGLYDVNMTEAVESDPFRYATFNEFFTRALKPSARPVDIDDCAFVSPVDGTVSQCGRIDHDTLIQAKGQSYSLHTLLGGRTARTERYVGGVFATIYLAPYNYHRIHMPIGGRVHATIYVPGDLFSVNAATALYVENLFARNERVVCEFDGANGPFAMVFVGALHVGSIETTWAGEINPPPRSDKTIVPIDRGSGTALTKGAEAGRFNMGSTVIVVTPPASVEFDNSVKAGTIVQMGQRIGTIQRP